MARKRFVAKTNDQAIGTFESVKIGHLAAVNYLISSMQTTDTNNRIEKGLGKESARMVTGIIEALSLDELETNNQQLAEDTDPVVLSGAQVRWIKDRIDSVFTQEKMPIWASRYALDISDNWQIVPAVEQAAS